VIKLHPRGAAALATAVFVLGLCAGSADASGGTDPFFPQIGDTSYDAGHYDVSLSYRSRGTIDAAVRIEATANQPLSSFALDLVGLKVRSVSVDGKPARFGRGKRKLVVTPAESLQAGQAFAVLVKYGGKPRSYVDVNEFREGWFETDDGAFTIGEPTGTPTWLPCNDVPADKATFTFHLTVPRKLTAVSNGRLTGIDRKGAHRTFTWTESQPMSTYLAVIDIGIGKLTRSRIAGLPSWTFVDRRLVKKSRKVLARVPEISRFESRLFGPYPFDSVGSIVDFSKQTANLETQTRPIYPHVPLPTIIVHELAHQWFGDSVGVSSWPEIWLNEGFASWAEWYYEETHGGETAAERFRSFFKPPLNNAGALLPPPADLGSPVFMFGPSVYNRGALTLQALRMKIGTKAMLKVLRAWTSTYRFGNAGTQQFIALAEEVSGRDLKALFQRFLFKPEKP
jgi:aminopeptidase N